MKTGIAAPYIKVKLRNPYDGTIITNEALVDTGSTQCGIPRRLVRALKLKPSGRMILRSPTGTSPVLSYHVELILGRKRYVVSAFEVQDPGPFIIGWDVIQKSRLLERISPVIPDQIVHFLDVIPRLKKKTVLVLGQDTSQKKRLEAIQKRLKHHGYTGIVVKDQPDIRSQSVEEKVNMLASLSSFVICENSIPSGHINELKICSLNRFVTVVIQEQGRGGTWMQADYPFDFSFMTSIKYSNIRTVGTAVDRAIEWAKNKQRQRREFFDMLYSWRKRQKNG